MRRRKMKIKLSLNRLFTLIVGLMLYLGFSVLLPSCSRKPYYPKQRSYYRIDVPDHDYDTFKLNAPFTCQISRYAKMKTVHDSFEPKFDTWYDINYPQWKGSIHLSYKNIKPEDFREISEESRTLVYKHTVRADAIQETYFVNDKEKVYGIFYEMKGPAASQAQFFLTDSLHHALRGSLYFQAIPNADSIAPIAEYIEEDMKHLMETLTWNK